MRTTLLALHFSCEDLPHMRIVNPGQLREARKTRRWTLRAVAKVIGCSHTQVGLYERGKTKTMPEQRACEFSKLYKIPLDSVFAPEVGFVMPESSNVVQDVA